eukprot:COSAG02_NODE_5804_length_4024_cov_5.645860_6_plen_71_part_00
MFGSLGNVVRWDETLVECGRENIGFATSRNAPPQVRSPTRFPRDQDRCNAYRFGIILCVYLSLSHQHVVL